MVTMRIPVVGIKKGALFGAEVRLHMDGPSQCAHIRDMRPDLMMQLGLMDVFTGHVRKAARGSNGSCHVDF